jgi:hypothetical protein
MVVLRLAKIRVAVMAVLRAFIVGALMTGFLAGPVCAQEKENKSLLKVEEEMRQKEGEAVDQQYKATLERTRKNTPEVRATTDPWQSMRGADDSKPKR